MIEIGGNLGRFIEPVLSDRKIREEFYDEAMSTNPQVAFTGTARQCIHHRNQNSTREWVDPQSLAKNCHRFVKQVTRHLCGSGAARRGELIRFAAGIQGHETHLAYGGERMHVHMALGGFPDDVSCARIETVLSEKWTNSLWGYEETKTDWLETDKDKERWCCYIVRKVTMDTPERFETNVKYNQ